MKILITGAYGQLGKCIYDSLYSNYLVTENEYLFASHDEFDLTDKENIERYFINHKGIECIINCAGYTNVDKAESDIYNAFKVNSFGVKNLVDECEKRDIMLFHISTDYVYKDGLFSVDENDECEPINKYGESKRDGELHIINSNLKNWYIFRTSWLYSYYPGNFFYKIADRFYSKEYYNSDLKVVTDEVGCPTYARALADMLICIIEHGYYATSLKNGIYNFCDGGMCSRYDFAVNIVAGVYNVEIDGKSIGIRSTVYPIEQKDLNLPASRPKHIVMKTDKIFNSIPVIRDHWVYNLQDCINEYEKRLNQKNNASKMIYGTKIY